jgi:hypothetical protein
MAFVDISGLSRFLSNLKGAFVSVEAQSLTAAQKKQARENIGVPDETVPEVYIGSGDMPDGYVLQIDPSDETEIYSKEECDSLFLTKEEFQKQLADALSALKGS